jgi:Tfp pilus assembly protein PilF
MRGMDSRWRVEPSGWVVTGLLIASLTPCAGCGVLRRYAESRQLSAARRLSMQGMAALHQDRIEDAGDLFARALAISSSDERAHWGHAEVLWRDHDHAQALREMEVAVELSGHQPELAVRLGQMYLEAGDLYAAGTQARTALQGDRQLASAWQLAGDVWLREGKIDDALKSYHRALALQPEFQAVQLSIAEAYYRSGRCDRMLATLDRLQEQMPGDACPAHVHFLRGLALVGLDRPDAAAEGFRMACELRPDDVELWHQLAAAELAAGDLAEARYAAESALRLEPSHEASRVVLLAVVSAEGRVIAGANEKNSTL